MSDPALVFVNDGADEEKTKEEAPRMAASLSLRIDPETGILPFHIGMRFSSIASRIGSMIQ